MHVPGGRAESAASFDPEMPYGFLRAKIF